MNNKKFSRRDILRGFLGSSLGCFTIPLLGKLPCKQRNRPKSYDFDKGMYAIITGSGSAMPDPERGNASAAVVIDGTILQFDCGRKAMDNLMLAGINPVNVDYIIFTHLHFDHIATYDYFIVSSWIAGKKEPFKVFGPPGTTDMSNGALFGKNKLNVKWWSKIRYRTVSGKREYLQPETEGPGNKPPVRVRDIDSGVIIEDKSLKVTATEVNHWGSDLDAKTEANHWGPGLGTKSLAYRIDSPYGSVAISGDTGPTQNMIELAKGADLLIHECVYPDDTQRTGHTHPTELGKLAQEAQVKKLVATHLGPFTSVEAAIEMSSPFYGSQQRLDMIAEFASAIKRNYHGPVIMAEDAMVFEVGN